jgi:hypothetical protein
MTIIRIVFSYVACLQDVSYCVTVLKCGAKFAMCTEKLHECEKIKNYSSSEEVLPVHAMKAYRESSGTAPLILNLCII